MKFGIIKSKIDKILFESYSNKNNFKNEIKNFNKYILENKSLAKLYWLYDELKTKKGVETSIVNDYINESINQFNKITKKISSKEIQKINEWIRGYETENLYVDIDRIFSDEVFEIEEKIRSKKNIAESLKGRVVTQKEHINLPINVMVNIANKTIDSYIKQLNEDDKNNLTKFLSKNITEMKSQYDLTKEQVLTKLENIKKESDTEVSNRIDETITKISKEKFDKLNLFRLEQLNKSI
jgi:hypothetical protein